MKSISFLSLSHQHNQIRAAVQEAIMRVYDKNRFILGDELLSFEKEFALWTGTKYCLGVGNGLDALTLALFSCGLSSRDEVIVPAHTYFATWLAISRTGARIRPVEPDEQTFNIDPSKIEEAITPDTKVILPVHLYGQPCDMTSIASIAGKHNLIVIEDNAQAQGARWMDNLTGSFGDISATSFYPSKNLGALGDGGAVTTSDSKKAEFIVTNRNYGFKSRNIAVQQGRNSRLDEIQAAILRIKLNHLTNWNNERRRLASIYYDQLKNIGDLILPKASENAHHVYHLFVIRTSSRDKLQEYLTRYGVETMVHYPIPPHLQQAYQNLNFQKGQFPKTERLANTILSLPLWPGMDDDQVDYVSDVVRNFFRS